jgi:PAS domain S-box-containing protein
MLKSGKHDSASLTVDELVAENEALRERLRQLEKTAVEQRLVENELRENADHYLSILEEMPDTFYRVDADGCLEFVSETVFGMLGYTSDELVGRSLTVLYAEPDGRDRFFAALVENGGALYNYHTQMRRRDGGLVWVSISSRLRHDQNGGIIGTQGTTRDITRQREAEEALRLSEERYALAATAINDGIWDTNLVTGEFYKSPRWYEILGFREEDVRPRRDIFYERLHPDDAVLVENTLARHFDLAEPYNIQIRMRHKDGHYIWARVKGNSVKDADGVPVRMLGSLSDVTARMRVTEALRESEARLRLVTDEIPALIAYFDHDQRVVFANRAYAEWAGIPQDKIIGRHIRDVIGLELYESTAGNRNKAYTGEMVSNEGRGTSPQGKSFYFRSTRIPRFDGEGGVLGYYFVMDDLTEHVDQEEQLRQAQKMDAVGQLTGGVAHEFNNLLLVIVGNLEVLLDQTTEAPLRLTATAALDSAMRGSELTRQLLAFSRKQTLDVKSVDANKLVLGISDMLQSVLGETISIETDLGDDVWPVLSDAGQIESALLNLTLNARDAMPGGGVITITTANQGGRVPPGNSFGDDIGNDIGEGSGDFVMIDVSDTGDGMTADVLDRAMDPFFTTKDVGSGTGLGLSIVFGFVEQSNGSVEIESEPGKGTHVKMYLPRALVDAVELPVAAGPDSPPPAPLELVEGGEFKGNVLVVEDDPMVRTAVAQMLGDLGCHVIEAEDGETAVALLAECPEIDLLFTDVVLPMGISGIDIANDARRRFPKLKILMSSGYPKKGVKEALPEGDGFWFLEKPYRAQDLSRTLAEIFTT